MVTLIKHGNRLPGVAVEFFSLEAFKLVFPGYLFGMIWGKITVMVPGEEGK